MPTFLRYLALLSLLTTTAIHAANPIIVVSIDGLRPDAIKKANAKTLLSLIARGTSFVNARTVRPSITLPSHTSMVTGLDPGRHGIWWNDYREEYGPVRHVTALELANNAGLHTIMIVAKDKLLHLHRPNSVDYFEKTDKEGAEVAASFERYVKRNGVPDVSFLHLPDPDNAGHKHMWNSPSYHDAVGVADEALKRILNTVEFVRAGKPFTIIITADHGGFLFNHTADIDLNNKIPFIAYGEKIAAGVEKHQVIRPYDVAATILDHIGVAIPNEWLGRPAPIREIASTVQQRLHETAITTW